MLNHDLLIVVFGIIHCVADSGVFGMLGEFPEDIDIEDDEWIYVKGKLSTIFYQHFKSTIPVLIVEEWQKTKEPKEPYVRAS